jgi:hypothetical protein
VDQTWPTVLNHSDFSSGQWEFIHDHIVYNSIALGLLLLAVYTWLASSDRWRRTLGWLLELCLLGSVVLMMIGAWHGGELVYRFGTGTGETASAQMRHDVKYFLPPLQLHVILAGLALSATLAAAALTVRRWHLLPEGRTSPAEMVTVTGDANETLVDAPPSTHEAFPGRYWLLGALVALIAAVFGLWATADVLEPKAFADALKEAQEPGHVRLLLHVIFGTAVIVLPLIVAALVRFAPRQRGLAGCFTLLTVLALGWQIWLGVAMLFDSHEGPLLGFNRPGIATSAPSEQVDSRGSAPATSPGATTGSDTHIRP